MPDTMNAAILHGYGHPLRIRRAQVRPGQRVPVHGGAGGVAHLAVQLAAARGAEVFATGSGAGLAVIESFGAPDLDHLPRATWRLLLLAAVDGTCDLSTLHAAAGASALDDLAPAERAGLVRVDLAMVRLMPLRDDLFPTVLDRATGSERRAAHRLLADTAPDRPGRADRVVRHCAAAATGPDEGVAGLLDAAAGRAMRRGDAKAAWRALRTAADLSADPAERARRRAEAAYVLGLGAGELTLAASTLPSYEELQHSPRGFLLARTTEAVLIANGHGDIDTAHARLASALASVDLTAGGAAVGPAYDALLHLTHRGETPALWQRFRAVTARIPARLVPDGAALLAQACEDPVHLPDAALGQLDRAIAELPDERDLAVTYRVAAAARQVDRLPRCRSALWQAVENCRRGAAPALAGSLIATLASDQFAAGQWDAVIALCDEGLAVARDLGLDMLGVDLRYVTGLVAAARGDAGLIRLTDEMADLATAHGVGTVRQMLAHLGTLEAAGQCDFERAYQLADAVVDAGREYRTAPALFLALDFVEAALRTGREKQARAYAAVVRDARIDRLSPRLALVARAVTAAVSLGDDADQQFRAALATPGADRWPFDFARVQLLYGERLRRLRAPGAAKVPLQAAADAFRRLDAEPWERRALVELRAVGVAAVERVVTHGMLTEQEHEIAALAASGLTNKEIGMRLYMSHRTVGAHLYRIFPKLGVTTRAALRDALNRYPADMSVAA